MLQEFDTRNRDLIVNIGGALRHRDEAGVSPFDSVVQGGDAVWEGLRLYQGKIFKLIEHLDRMHASAKALGFEMFGASIPSHEEIIIEIRRTLEANKMTDGVHIRLTLSRGEKITSGMDPRLNQSGPTLIVLAEFKSPVYSKKGLSFVTSSMRRSPPDFLDPRIHHNNLLSSIMAKIEANMAGADSALMLDTHGFIAEAHGSHVFFVRGGPSSGIAARAGSTVGNPEDGGTEERSEADSGAGPGSEVDGVETDRETSPSVCIFTPSTDACPKGITRETVLRLCHENGIAAVVRNISLAEAYNADEMFCTGTMGEIAGITKLDGRTIGTGEVGPVTLQIAELYRAVTASQGFEMVG